MASVRDVTLLLLPGTRIRARVCPFSHKCRVARQSLSGDSSPWQRAEDAHDGSHQKCAFVFPFHSNGEVIVGKLDQRSPFLRSL